MKDKTPGLLEQLRDIQESFRTYEWKRGSQQLNRLIKKLEEDGCH